MATNDFGTTMFSMPEHLTAIVHLAGTQITGIDTHDMQGVGAHVTVAIGGAMLWLRDQTTAGMLVDLFTGINDQHRARTLPEHRGQVATQPAVHRPLTVGYTPRHRDRMIAENIRREAAIFITGTLRWAIYDRAAYTNLAELWRCVDQLSRLVLPVFFLPTI